MRQTILRQVILIEGIEAAFPQNILRSLSGLDVFSGIAGAAQKRFFNSLQAFRHTQYHFFKRRRCLLVIFLCQEKIAEQVTQPLPIAAAQRQQFRLDLCSQHSRFLFVRRHRERINAKQCPQPAKAAEYLRHILYIRENCVERQQHGNRRKARCKTAYIETAYHEKKEKNSRYQQYKRRLLYVEIAYRRAARDRNQRQQKHADQPGDTRRACFYTFSVAIRLFPPLGKLRERSICLTVCGQRIVSKCRQLHFIFVLHADGRQGGKGFKRQLSQFVRFRKAFRLAVLLCPDAVHGIFQNRLPQFFPIVPIILLRCSRHFAYRGCHCRVRTCFHRKLIRPFSYFGVKLQFNSLYFFPFCILIKKKLFFVSFCSFPVYFFRRFHDEVIHSAEAFFRLINILPRGGFSVLSGNLPRFDIIIV